MQPMFRQWKFVLAGGLAAAALVAAVVFTNTSDSKRVTPATDVTSVTVTTTSPSVTTVDTEVTVTPTVTNSSVVPATSEVQPTTATTEPITASSLTLRQGGVGDYDFGAPMDDVVGFVNSTLGTGQVFDHNESNDPIQGCSVHITAYWPAAGLELGFADDGDQNACTGTPVLAGWRLFTPLEPRTIDVRLAGGIGIGSSFDAVQQAIAGLELYGDSNDIYSGVPSWAAAGTGDQRIGVSFGSWDYVTAVQRGLIADGADIVADGQLGSATSAAYQAFVAAHPGLSNQQLFELLGALPPVDAGVTVISAGDRWWWEPYECGSTPFWTLEGEMCNL